jgi:hypothetical protein
MAVRVEHLIPAVVAEEAHEAEAAEAEALAL